MNAAYIDKLPKTGMSTNINQTYKCFSNKTICKKFNWVTKVSSVRKVVHIQVSEGKSTGPMIKSSKKYSFIIIDALSKEYSMFNYFIIYI